MLCQPCSPSLTSRRRRAVPPALGVEAAACPNYEEVSLPHLSQDNLEEIANRNLSLLEAQ
jgi:hypothetical protein